MRSSRRETLLWVVLFLLLSRGVTPGEISARDDRGNLRGQPERPASFVLTIHDERISLKATNASVKAILEELGRQLHIAVEATIPPEETITTEFTGLPLEEALQRLSSNYAYVTDSAKDTGRITKIIVTPAGRGQASNVPPSSASKAASVTQEADRQSAKPEPFKFEFDPSKFMKEGE